MLLVALLFADKTGRLEGRWPKHWLHAPATSRVGCHPPTVRAKRQPTRVVVPLGQVWTVSLVLWL